MKKFITIVALALLIVIGAIYTARVSEYPEQYNGVSWTMFREALNDGDEAAIQKYKEAYVSRGIYLYEGPLTQRLFAEKVGEQYMTIHDAFNGSGLSFQEFADSWEENRQG